MKLSLLRKDFTDFSTIGDLLIDGNFECYSLEDTVRKHKVTGKTAIPSGTYEIIVSWSNRFKMETPRLLRVPYYDGILIHPGNDYEDTEGCILVGQVKLHDQIANSRLAYNSLFPKIQSAVRSGKVFIEIIGGVSADKWEEYNANKKNDLV